MLWISVWFVGLRNGNTEIVLVEGLKKICLLYNGSKFIKKTFASEYLKTVQFLAPISYINVTKIDDVEIASV